MYSAGMNRYFEFAEGSLFCGKKNLLYNLDKPELFKDIPTYVKEKKEKLISTHDRNRIKIIQSEMAYNYTCQINPDHKTFIVEGTSHQYMEGHHIIPLNRQQYFEYSLDCYANILVVCPTCHRFFHYAEKPKRVDKLKKIYDERAERLSNSGIKIDVKEFIDLTNSKPSDTFYSYY